MASVLVAMSGGVDSSVAAAILRDEGHEVVGVTLKLWGGESDRGCCSVADVDDARWVARRLGIDHLVFNFSEDFQARVVDPYVVAHRHGRTPNPCIECNRHLKFDRLVARADALGFDAVATGHHCRVVRGPDGVARIGRGADRAKDQSYVVHMLGGDRLARLRFPVGDLTKVEVRALAAGLGLRTASKPDSQEVCFITASGGRRAFLGERIALRPGVVVDGAGAPLGRVEALELVTVGQRRGLGLAGGGPARFVTSIDPATSTVTVGAAGDLLVDRLELDGLTWSGPPTDGPVLAQVSAHGAPRPGTVAGSTLWWARPERRVAPGQTVVLYDLGDAEVLAAATAR